MARMNSLDISGLGGGFFMLPRGGARRMEGVIYNRTSTNSFVGYGSVEWKPDVYTQTPAILGASVVNTPWNSSFPAPDGWGAIEYWSPRQQRVAQLVSPNGSNGYSNNGIAVHYTNSWVIGGSFKLTASQSNQGGTQSGLAASTNDQIAQGLTVLVDHPTGRIIFVPPPGQTATQFTCNIGVNTWYHWLLVANAGALTLYFNQSTGTVTTAAPTISAASVYSGPATYTAIALGTTYHMNYMDNAIQTATPRGYAGPFIVNESNPPTNQQANDIWDDWNMSFRYMNYQSLTVSAFNSGTIIMGDGTSLPLGAAIFLQPTMAFEGRLRMIGEM